jgi:hypothetical protein
MLMKLNIALDGRNIHDVFEGGAVRLSATTIQCIECFTFL